VIYCEHFLPATTKRHVVIKFNCQGFLFLCIGYVVGLHLVLMATGLLPLPCVLWGVAIQILYTRVIDASFVRADSLLLMATCGELLVSHHLSAFVLLTYCYRCSVCPQMPVAHVHDGTS